MKTYYYIGSMGHIKSTEAEGYELSYKLRKSMGNYFETYKAAERYTDYILAKEAIKEDTKGFNPDWSDKKSNKFYGYWDFERGFKNYYKGGKPVWDSIQTIKEPNIYFKSWEDIEESFEKHPKEWKIYLTYEQ